MATSVVGVVGVLEPALCSFVKLSLACRWQATGIPGGYSEIHLLVFCGCDVVLVDGACRAELRCPSLFFGAVQGEVVRAGDVVHVVAYRCGFEIRPVEINRHEELAVISFDYASSRSHSVRRPLCGFVTVVTIVLLGAPRVSHLYKLDLLARIIGDLFDAQGSILVTKR